MHHTEIVQYSCGLITIQLQAPTIHAMYITAMKDHALESEHMSQTSCQCLAALAALKYDRVYLGFVMTTCSMSDLVARPDADRVSYLHHSLRCHLCKQCGQFQAISS